MEKIRQDIKAGGSSLHPPINHDANPTYMSRSAGKGKSGSGNSLPPNRGEYGLGLGKDIVRMSRKVTSSGPGGKTFRLFHEGPGRAPRSDKGSISHDSPTFGVNGVTEKAGTGYGVGGV